MAKTIFITGASSGLGKATAKLFAERGWQVLASMRNSEKETELTQFKNIKLIMLDVTNPQQVQDVVGNVIRQYKVDVVFNNAGYGLGGPFEGTTEEELARQFDTNVMGVFRITKAFMPHFRSNGGGIFITTTSIGGYMAFPMFSPYHATKWALEGWSESLWFEMSHYGIRVKTVAPGGIKTDFDGRSLALAKHEAYTEMFESAERVLRDPMRTKGYSTPGKIAQTVYKAATDGSSRLRYIAGWDAKAAYIFRRVVGYKMFMKLIAKMFK